MKYDLEGKVFKSISNTDNGEVGQDTIFNYHQKEDLVWAEYFGGAIVKGQLIAKVLKTGQLDMRYHHINIQGQIKAGKCLSTPELVNNKLKFKEAWKWLGDNESSGYSEIIEQ